MSRLLPRLLILLPIAVLAVLPSARPADAVFHLAVIDELMVGFDGDPDVQYIEVRMDAPGQNLVHDTLLSVFDEDADPPLTNLLILPEDVQNDGINVRWLMATQAFADLTGVQPDVLIPAGLLTPKGLVCWGAPDFAPPPDEWPGGEAGWNLPFLYTDCVSYGGYVGPPAPTHPPAFPLAPGDGTTALQRLAPLAPGTSALSLSTGVEEPPDADTFALRCPTPETNDGAVTLLGPDDDNDGLPNCHEDELGTVTGEVDSDSDGCADGEEVGPGLALGGGRDPTDFWDFFDTPDASNVRDRIISASDITRVVARFGATGTQTTVQDALSAPPASGYHAAFDRSPSAGPSGPANGSISAGDIALVVSQFGHSCAAAP